MEGDGLIRYIAASHLIFQSTPSVWRETLSKFDISASISISIHSLRVEGDSERSATANEVIISIHSLRVEGDVMYGYDTLLLLLISIHSLRVEGDHGSASGIPHTARYFNPLPPCGGRPRCVLSAVCSWNFNPLPPCGGRHSQNRILLQATKFQSTPSVWRETRSSAVSTHSG